MKMPKRKKSKPKHKYFKSAADWVATLPRPDDVGSAEYRAIHELLAGVEPTGDTLLDLRLMDAILSQFCAHADNLRLCLAGFLKK